MSRPMKRLADVKISTLDLVPVRQDKGTAASLHNSLNLAQHVEKLGYNRFWVAEHHNMDGIASSATSVLLGYLAGGTSTIRVGAGGVMLPNHAPLVIAEQFGTLASLYPGRIDLGLGRAPGTDQPTARALRRHLSGGAETFPNDVVELLHYFEEAKPGQAVRAVPGAGLDVEAWILGSSTYGAQLAAMLGLPYAFASHFAPAELERALAIYRERFQPSERLAAPRVMLGVNVIAADTKREARYLYSSLQQAFVALRFGTPGKLPPPVEDMEGRLDLEAKAMLDQALSCAVVGSPGEVEAGLAAFIERTGADELMITGSIFDHAARLRSFEIAEIG